MHVRSARNRLAVASALPMLVLALGACGSSEVSGPQEAGPEQHRVDSDGASVVAQAGNVVLGIPAGALPSATTITVEAASGDPADPNLVPGTSWEFGPDGLQFEEPVTLRLTYDPTAIPDGAGPETLGIYKRGGSGWISTDNGAVDVSSTTVTGEIDGFSQFAIVSFGALSVTTVLLQAGVEQVQYFPAALTATGGDGVYTWTIASGALPAGLSLAPDGTINGTPESVGTASATVEVTSGDGQTAQQALSITVGPRPILLPTDLCTDHPGYAVATFDDVRLDAAAKEAVGLVPEDALSCDDAANVQFILGTAAGITSLVGIQNLPNLLELSLGENPSVDIAPLGTSNLPRLRAIRLYSTSLTDISVLQGFSSLTRVDLHDNAITDISPLSALPGLTFLSLNNNLVTDLGPLSGLTGLIYLELKGNSIVDVGALSGLTSLIDLRLSDNRITGVSALGGLTNLTVLQLDNNRISGFQIGSGMTSLEILLLNGNTIDGEPFDPLTPYRSPISGIQALTGLRNLDLTGTPIGAFEPLLAFQPLLSNTGLGAGDSVLLKGTLVDCSVVTSLENKGVSAWTGGECS